MSWNTPQSWRWATIGEVAQVVGGGTPSTGDPTNFVSGGIPWITPADLSGYSGTYISAGARGLTRKGLEGSGARLIPQSSVLFSSRAPIGYCVIARQPVSTNQGFKSLVLDQTLSPEYARHYLLFSKHRIQEMASGTTFKEISGKRLAELTIPVPPRSEQDRIVACIDSHFSRIDATVISLDRAKAKVKLARASVLKAAVEGRLVPTEAELARAEGRKYEPASVRLERLLAERQAKWESAGKKGKYKTPAAPKSGGLLELPEGWVWVTPKQISSGDKYDVAIGPFGSNLRVPDYRQEGVPLVFVRHVRAERFSGLDDKFVTSKKAGELAAHIVRGGDVLITKMGEPPGDSAWYPIEAPVGVITADVIKWTPADPTSAKFLVYTTRDNVIRSQVRNMTQGVAQKKISLERFLRIAYPLPPLAEQDRIVAEIERRFSLLDSMDKTIDLALLHCAQLRQSILKCAFEGRLLSADQVA